ncbi:response regulator [Paenibacillus dendritiformis]|uniref:response regulator transcription factor n=1 Tax=Paenibacillus dendritiformis TaxID=130049 RepID=UPI00365211F4
MYRVMIVDDEHMIHLSLRKLIETSGLELIVAGEAEDGAEALSLLGRCEPDIVITDICMPEMDGLALIQEVKKRREGIRFIIVSGYAEFDYARQAIRYGVTDFLLKPIEPEPFIATLRHVQLQLDESASRFARHHAWVLQRQLLLSALCDAVWAIEEDGVQSKLEQLIGHYTEAAPDLAFSRYAREIAAAVEANIGSRGFILAARTAAAEEWPGAMRPCVDLLRRVLDTIMGELKGSRNLGSRQHMMKAVKYLEAHYAEERLSLKDVADWLGMSAPYLSRSFKEVMNLNFSKHLTAIRLDKAKDLLQSGDLPSTEIAFQVGFSDYPHFSKMFKKRFGLPPADYRKQFRRSR